MPISSSQFGGDVQTPMALGSSTTGTFAQSTAWRTPRGGGAPAPYSKRTMGTTMKWDDDNSGPSIPKADKGVGRNDG